MSRFGSDFYSESSDVADQVADLPPIKQQNGDDRFLH